MRSIERDPIAGELNAFWNAVAAGASELPSVSDASLADLVLAIHRSDTVEGASMEFRRRLLGQVESTAGGTTSRVAVRPRAMTPQRRWADVESSQHRYRWAAAMLAFLIVAAGGFLFWADGQREEAPALIPAPTEPAIATPAPAYRESTLLDLRIDPAEFGLDPAAQWSVTFFDEALVEHGQSFVLCQKDFCGEGIAALSVLDGTMTVSFDAPALVITETGQTVLDPGTEVLLQPGNAVVFSALSMTAATAGEEKRLDLLMHFTGVNDDAVIKSRSMGIRPDNLQVFMGASDLALEQPLSGPVRLTIDMIDADRTVLVPVRPVAGEVLMLQGVQQVFGMTSEGDPPIDPSLVIWEASFDDMPKKTYEIGNPTGPLHVAIARMSPA